MATETILVVGGTGTLGEPVARRLLRDGYQVRLLARDVERARARLSPDYTYCPGDIDDTAALGSALAGCAGVHISLKAVGRHDAERVEHHGPARIAALAARQGVARLTYVSGYLVSPELAGTPADRAKLRAEGAVRGSGVSHTIFKPTYFMETLPRHIQGNLAIVLGRQPHPLHMIAADDFAGMVSRAYRTPEAANRELYVRGPEALTIAAGLRLYCALVEPGKRVVSLPLPLMALVDRLVLRGRLRDTLDLMRVMQRVGERGDPAEANRLLGAPATTLRQWCEQRQRARGGAASRPSHQH